MNTLALVFALAAVAVAPSLQNDPRCAHELAQEPCMIYFGELVVFDSKTNECVVQSSGCSIENVTPWAFDSMADCQAKCMPKKPVELSLKEKCSYQAPDFTCEMYIGENIVFDSKSGKCITQTGGCSVDDVKPYAWNTLEQCQASCLTDKCSYQIPRFTCMHPIGNPIVFDSARGMCTYQRSGCDKSGIKPFSFTTMDECKAQCGGTKRM